MGKEKEVQELIEKFSWEQADEITREKLAKELSEIFGFEVIDTSVPKNVDNQYLQFRGMSSSLTTRLFN